MNRIYSAEFWDFLDRLVAQSEIVIDRPRGSAHPAFPDLIYPLDYGYLAGTQSMDGGGIDLWLGSLPERRLDALALTVDLQKRDAEIKLLLGCCAAEQEIIMEFLNGAGMRALLVRRDPRALLQERRSVRRFQPRPIPPQVLEQVIEAATWAPSAHNQQPWRFVVLRSSAARLALAQGLGEAFYCDLLRDGLAEAEASERVEASRRRIERAPAAILLCLDQGAVPAASDQRRQALEQLMAAQSVALAGENLLLAAQALGLGAVWMCAPLFAPEVAQRVLDLPASWQPQSLILLGYPAAEPKPRPRFMFAEVMIER